MRFRHCVFDLYGTLVDIHTDESSFPVWERTAALFARAGASFDPLELRESYFRLIHQEEAAARPPLRQDAHEAHPEIQIENVFHGLFQEKGINADPGLVVRTARGFRMASTEYIRLYDGAFELLRALRDAGRKVWLLSNAQSCFTRMELEDLQLSPLFDGIFLSSDYRCKKPDLAFFELFLKQCRIDPREAVMIGNDGVCDIQGAAAAGLSTLYLHSNLSPKENTPPADYVLEGADLAAVGQILL